MRMPLTEDPNEHPARRAARLSRTYFAQRKKREWLDLRGFLERFLDRTRDTIAYYNVSQGLQFTKREHQGEARIAPRFFHRRSL